MSTALKSTLIVVATLLPLASMAQQAQQPSPEQMKQIMQATMGAMVSVMGPMTEAVIEAQLAMAAKRETAERIAAFKKSLYESLVQKGFKPQDAMQIVIATSAPTASPSTK